jgi:dUTP pyrophosphatase
MIDIKVKKTNDKALIPFKTYDKDFCYDCIATSREEIAPNVYKYGLGLAFEIDRQSKYTGLNISLDFRPRSSVWKTGMILSNCEGTVDELFRGEVSAVFYHILRDMPIYEVGDKIIQFKVGLTEPINFIPSDELSKTERQNGSYGSTGK